MEPRKVRVILMTVVFVILLIGVAYMYYEPAPKIDPVQEPPVEETTQDGNQPGGTQPPPERPPQRPNDLSEIPAGGQPG